MPPSGVSRTAIACAVMRRLHRLWHDAPWVLDDPYAERLAGPRWDQALQRLVTSYPSDRLNEMICGMVVRTRYTEDRLRSGSFTQYVLLGAGLDSVAFRGLDIDRAVRILEVDDTPTQNWKRERIEQAGLSLPPDHVFVPVDFESDDFLVALGAAGVDRERPTLISWLGVTQYLTREAVENTLRSLTTFAPGSEVVLTYQAAEHAGDSLVPARTAAIGEPFLTVLTYDEAERLTADCGLRVREHLTNDDMRDRYFGGRSDGLTPPAIQRTIAAEIVG